MKRSAAAFVGGEGIREVALIMAAILLAIYVAVAGVPEVLLP